VRCCDCHPVGQGAAHSSLPLTNAVPCTYLGEAAVSWAASLLLLLLLLLLLPQAAARVAAAGSTSLCVRGAAAQEGKQPRPKGL
jgi:hypothetical protein